MKIQDLPPSILTLGAVLLAVAAAVLVLWLMQAHARIRDPITLRSMAEGAFPLYDFKPKPLLTPNELHFFHRLQHAFSPHFVLLTQVGLGALVDSTLPEGHHHRLEHRGKFVGKLIDFVLCDARTMRVLCVIELDDITHDELKDKHRDHFLAQVGIPTLRYESQHKPSVEQLKSDLAKHLPNYSN